MAPIPDFPSLEVPPITQIGFVVRDMDAALAFYGPLFGPFNVVDFTNRNFTYRGQPADCELRVAYGWSGEVEIELIQPVSGAGPHREALGQGREGMHHVQFRVPEIDSWIARFEKAGYSRQWEKRAGNFAFVYLQHALQPTVIEFVSPVARSKDRFSGHVVID